MGETPPTVFSWMSNCTAPRERVADVGLKIQVFAVPRQLNADGSKPDSKLVVERTFTDLDFGPNGTRHEAVFVVGHLCQQVAVLAEINKPAENYRKAELPFSCDQ